MDSQQYIEAKRKCRWSWQCQVHGFADLPSDYQQLLLDRFNMIWDAGASSAHPHWKGVVLPRGTVVQYNGVSMVQGAPVPYENLCDIDQQVYDEAVLAGRLPHD